MLELLYAVLNIIGFLCVFLVFLMLGTFLFGPKLFWCKLWGLHRWEYPGGNCEDCGKHDDFFD